MQVAFDNTQLVRLYDQGQGRVSRLHFSKNGCFGGISVSQTHLVFGCNGSWQFVDQFCSTSQIESLQRFVYCVLLQVFTVIAL